MRCIARISHQALVRVLMTLSCSCFITHAGNTIMLRKGYKKVW